MDVNDHEDALGYPTPRGTLWCSEQPKHQTWRFRREERRCEQLMAEKGALSVWSTGLDLGPKGPEGPKGKSNRNVKPDSQARFCHSLGSLNLRLVESCCFMLFLYSVPDL